MIQLQSWHKNGTWCPLEPGTVFDYFRECDLYYDQTCNYEKFQAQGLSHELFQELIKKSPGISFEKYSPPGSDEQCLVIRKIMREANGETKNIAYYYIVSKVPTSPQDPPFGTVIELPSLQSLLRANLVNFTSLV